MPVDWGNNVDTPSTVDVSMRYEARVAAAMALDASMRYQAVYDTATPIRFSSIVILTTSLATGTVGVSYSENITARGGTDTGYTWAVVSGTLPPGLALASPNTPTTTLSGTPTAAGSYTFTVRVTDSGGSTDDQEFTLVIGAAPTVLAGYRDTLRGGRRLAIIDAAFAYTNRNDTFLAPAVNSDWTTGTTNGVITPTTQGVVMVASATANSEATLTQSTVAAYGDAQVTIEHLQPELPPAANTNTGLEWFVGTNAVSLTLDYVNGELCAVLRTRAVATTTLLARVPCTKTTKLRLVKAVSAVFAFVDGTFLAKTSFLGTAAGNLRLVTRSGTAGVQVSSVMYDFTLSGGVAIDSQLARISISASDGAYLECVVPAAASTSRLGQRPIEAFTPTTGVYSATGFTYTMPFERLYLNRRSGTKPNSSIYGRRSLKS